jgi:hypothetical protein
MGSTRIARRAGTAPATAEFELAAREGTEEHLVLRIEDVETPRVTLVLFHRPGDLVQLMWARPVVLDNTRTSHSRRCGSMK